MTSGRPLGRLCYGLLLLVAGVLAGCSWLVLPSREPPGALRTQVLQRLGPPTAVFTLPTGVRLLYSQQPAGFEVHRLDFDAQDRLVRNDQVMTASQFALIVPGVWERDELLQNFGPPRLIERVARFEGDIWTYRFLESNNPRLAHVHLDVSGRVHHLLFADEWLNDRDPRD